MVFHCTAWGVKGPGELRAAAGGTSPPGIRSDFQHQVIHVSWEHFQSKSSWPRFLSCWAGLAPSWNAVSGRPDAVWALCQVRTTDALSLWVGTRLLNSLLPLKGFITHLRSPQNQVTQKGIPNSIKIVYMPHSVPNSGNGKRTVKSPADFKHWELVRPPPVPVSSCGHTAEPGTGLPGLYSLRVHRWKGAGPGWAEGTGGSEPPLQCKNVYPSRPSRSQHQGTGETQDGSDHSKIIQNQW